MILCCGLRGLGGKNLVQEDGGAKRLPDEVAGDRHQTAGCFFTTCKVHQFHMFLILTQLHETVETVFIITSSTSTNRTSQQPNEAWPLFLRLNFFLKSGNFWEYGARWMWWYEA